MSEDLQKFTKCKICGERGHVMSILYFGLPGKYCDKCSGLTGLASYAPPVASDTPYGPRFKFLAYDGTFWGYLTALWFFLFGDHDELDTDYK